MNCSHTVEHALEVFRPEVEKFKELGTQFQSDDEDGACEAFGNQVVKVESVIEYAYQIVVLATKQCDSAEGVFDLWDRYLEFVEKLTNILSNLLERFPECGTAELHDHALDYYQSARKRRDLAKKEIECQKTTIPKGLFPSLS